MSISHTGHSLGAIIAQISFMTVLTQKHHLGSNHLAPCVFESPGALPIVERMIAEKTFDRDWIGSLKTTSIYLSDVNIINSCNAQLGKVYRPNAYPFDLTAGGAEPTLSITLDYFLNLYYAVNYSVCDQHRMEKMYLYMVDHDRPSDEFHLETKSPTNLREGYYQYLDGRIRNKYWNSYFKWIWDHYPAMRSDYKDLNDFLVRSLNELKHIQETSIKPRSALTTQGLFPTPNVTSVKVDDEEFDFELINPSKERDSKEEVVVTKRCLVM